MSYAFLVPFRGAGHRARLWALIRARLEVEHPEAAIIEADSAQTPFNKSEAVNEAARRASAQVLFVWDADCWAPPDQIRRAAEAAAGGGCWARPWRRKVKLGPEETERILALGSSWDGSWDPKAPREAMNTFWASPPLALRRDAFAEVGGMDERFAGWGGEDIAFARALWKTGYGLGERIHGDCLHLWHPRIGRLGHDLWEGQGDTTVNDHLVREYDGARTPEQMRELIARRA